MEPRNIIRRVYKVLLGSECFVAANLKNHISKQNFTLYQPDPKPTYSL
jgi:hypothetical protein